MYQVESSESLEGVFRGGLINRGKNVLKRFDSLYKLPGSSKFYGAWQVVGEIWQEVFLRRKLACGTHLVLEYFVWLRQESSKSIGSLKRTEIDSGDAKIDCGR